MACNVEIFLHVVLHRVSHFAGVNNSDHVFWSLYLESRRLSVRDFQAFTG